MATPTVNYYRDATGQYWALSLNTDGSANTFKVTPQGPVLATPTYSYFIDSSGQYWEFSINPDGSAQTTQISAPTPSPNPGSVTLPNTQSTITLLESMEWAKRFVSNRNFAIGNYLEPAITSANIIKQTIMNAPFKWRWNRVVTGFVTTPGQQDYYVFNWTASTQVEAGWLTMDSNGCSQQATNAGTTGTTQPSWNINLGGPTFDGSGLTQITWVNLGAVHEYASQAYNFGWIEEASVQDANAKWYEMEQKISLAADATQARPRFIAGQYDDGSGNVLFRVTPSPDGIYPIAITLQENPTLFNSVNQTWAPIPDHYANIFNWGFLALMFLFSDDPRFQLANQKFVTQILGTNQGLDQTDMNIFLNNWEEVTGAPIANQTRMQQGNSARGV